MARDMEAKAVLLTHFSQRYPKVPFDTVPGLAHMSIGTAHDLMCVSRHRLHLVPSVMPAMRNAVKEAIGEVAGEAARDGTRRGRSDMRHSGLL